jgi:hypothetical protein
VKPRQTVIAESWTAMLAFRLATGNSVLAFREHLLKKLKVLARDELTNDWPDYVNPHHDSLYAALRLDGLSPEQAQDYLRTVLAL